MHAAFETFFKSKLFSSFVSLLHEGDESMKLWMRYVFQFLQIFATFFSKSFFRQIFQVVVLLNKNRSIIGRNILEILTFRRDSYVGKISFSLLMTYICLYNWARSTFLLQIVSFCRTCETTKIKYFSFASLVFLLVENIISSLLLHFCGEKLLKVRCYPFVSGPCCWAQVPLFYIVF